MCSPTWAAGRLLSYLSRRALPAPLPYNFPTREQLERETVISEAQETTFRMGQKRQGDTRGDAAAPDAKKRKGFRVGPDNLPDGPWKRKSTFDPQAQPIFFATGVARRGEEDEEI